MKKNIIILGGNSSKNIKWLKQMEVTYKNDYNVYGVYYDNWFNNTDIDFEIELKKLENLTKALKEYTIICKSAGSIITLKAVDKEMINPSKIVIMGLPLRFIDIINIDIKNLLNRAKNNRKILIIQQKDDPQGKAKEVHEIIGNDIELIEIPGHYHTYTKYKNIKELIDKFISKT